MTRRVTGTDMDMDMDMVDILASITATGKLDQILFHSDSEHQVRKSSCWINKRRTGRSVSLMHTLVYI